MTDTPETDALQRTTLNPVDWIDLAESLERQRDAYAETLREIAQLSIWLSDVPLGDTIRERHPELAENAEAIHGEKGATKP